MANIPCPECPVADMTTEVLGATDELMCFCKLGYYLWEHEDEVTRSCEVCGAGANCSYQGINLVTLPLLPGYYREHVPDRRSQVIYKCPVGDATDRTRARPCDRSLLAAAE